MKTRIRPDIPLWETVMIFIVLFLLLLLTARINP